MLQTIIVYTSLTWFMYYSIRKSITFRGIRSKLFYWVPVFLFTFVFGIRYGVGVDYFSYKEIYEGYKVGDLFDEIGEWSFYLICDICHQLDLSVPAFFSILSFLQILFLYLAFRKKKIVLSYSILALFLTGIGISGFNNIIRQAIAFCIFVYSLTFIERKKILGYCLCILLAFSFHFSAIILFPIYFLFNKGQSYIQSVKLQIIIVLCCYCISWLNIGSIISSKIEYLSMFLNYDGYFNTHFVEAKNRSIFDIVIFIINILLVCYYKVVKQYYNDRLFEIIYTLFYISICLGYVLIDIHIIWRVLVYFSYLKFILFGYYMFFFKKEMKRSWQNYICAIFFWGYVFGFYCYSVLYKSYNSCSIYSTYYQTDLYNKQERMNLDYYE